MSPAPNPRSTGFPAQDAPQSERYEATFAPGTDGHTLASPVVAPPSSIVSGQNVWVREGEFQPRWKLSKTSVINPATPGGDAPVIGSHGSTIYGAVVYQSIHSNAQAPYYVIGTGNNFYIGSQNDSPSDLSFSAMSYVSSTGSSIPPNLADGRRRDWFGATVYSAATNQNILMMSGDTKATYCFAGNPATGLIFSHATQAPAAVDIVTFQNRAVAWNTKILADIQFINTRVQWSVAGDPFDWVGIGSGSEDLVDMQGLGTRIFVRGDDMLLATNRELWTGRYIGPPYYFQFDALTTTQGIPYKRAALQTPEGIVWLGEDMMVYALRGNQIAPVGTAFQTLLRRTLINPEVAFFTYHKKLRHLRLFYNDANSFTAWPNRSITLDTSTGAWFQERYNHTFQRGVSTPMTYYSTFPLDGGSAGNGQPWGQSELLWTSARTTTYFAESETSDLLSTVTQEAVLGALFTDDTRYAKTLKEVRVDVRSDGASDLTIGVSPTLGSAYSEIKVITNSSGSFPLQSTLTFDTEALYPTLRIHSLATNRWRISRVYAMAERQGR